MKKVLAIFILLLLGTVLVSVPSVKADGYKLDSYIPAPKDFHSLENTTLVIYSVITPDMKTISHTHIVDNKPSKSYYDSQNGTWISIPGFTYPNNTNEAGFTNFTYSFSRTPANITVTYPDSTKDVFHFNIPDPPKNSTTHILLVTVIKGAGFTIDDLGYKYLEGKKLIITKVAEEDHPLSNGTLLSNGVKVGEINKGTGVAIVDKSVDDLDLEVNGKIYPVMSSYGTGTDLSSSTTVQYLFIRLEKNITNPNNTITLAKEHPILATLLGGMCLLFMLVVVTAIFRVSKRRW